MLYNHCYWSTDYMEQCPLRITDTITRAIFVSIILGTHIWLILMRCVHQLKFRTHSHIASKFVLECITIQYTVVVLCNRVFFYKIVAVYFMCSTKLCYRLLKFLTALLFTTSYVALTMYNQPRYPSFWFSWCFHSM